MVYMKHDMQNVIDVVKGKVCQPPVQDRGPIQSASLKFTYAGTKLVGSEVRESSVSLTVCEMELPPPWPVLVPASVSDESQRKQND